MKNYGLFDVIGPIMIGPEPVGLDEFQKLFMRET